MRGILLKNCNFAAEFKIIAMEFTGKIIAILPPRGGVSKTSGNEWKSQEYVIENHDQYPRKMCFDVFGADKIEQFNIQMGEELTVSFDVDARQWNDRWFNSIRAWKVERVSAGAPMASGSPVPPPAPSAMPEFTPDRIKLHREFFYLLFSRKKTNLFLLLFHLQKKKFFYLFLCL